MATSFSTRNTAARLFATLSPHVRATAIPATSEYDTTSMRFTSLFCVLSTKGGEKNTTQNNRGGAGRGGGGGERSHDQNTIHYTHTYLLSRSVEVVAELLQLSLVPRQLGLLVFPHRLEVLDIRGCEHNLAGQPVEHERRHGEARRGNGQINTEQATGLWGERGPAVALHTTPSPQCWFCYRPRTRLDVTSTLIRFQPNLGDTKNMGQRWGFFLERWASCKALLYNRSGMTTTD